MLPSGSRLSFRELMSGNILNGGDLLFGGAKWRGGNNAGEVDCSLRAEGESIFGIGYGVLCFIISDIELLQSFCLVISFVVCCIKLCSNCQVSRPAFRAEYNPRGRSGTL